ncbi:MAG: AzlC family ABC transporter permease, partial [Clostridia bacterium]|nr:AzlC family ABC transporter permease [Clostridia bacterium]
MNHPGVTRQAFLKSLPVMAGYIVLGTGFGILLRNAGYGVLWAFAMSALIYAGSMQYVGVGLLTGGASLLSTALTTVMVNARHLFSSISMISRYQGAEKYKPYMIFALTDET